MGLRDSLEQIKALTEIPFAHTAGDHELIYQIATEALAKQPAAVVELTDAEIFDSFTDGACIFNKTIPFSEQEFRGLRAVIAAYIAKQSGGAA